MVFGEDNDRKWVAKATVLEAVADRRVFPNSRRIAALRRTGGLGTTGLSPACLGSGHRFRCRRPRRNLKTPGMAEYPIPFDVRRIPAFEAVCRHQGGKDAFRCCFDFEPARTPNVSSTV